MRFLLCFSFLFSLSFFSFGTAFAASIDGNMLPIVKPEVCRKAVEQGGLGGDCKEPICDDGTYACLWIETDGCDNSVEKPIGYCTYDDNDRDEGGEITVCCVDKDLEQEKINAVTSNKDNLKDIYFSNTGCIEITGGKCETEDDVAKRIGLGNSSSCDSGYTKVGICKAGSDNYYCCTQDEDYLRSIGVFGSDPSTGALEYGEYTLLEPLPGSDNTSGNLQTYLETLYRVALVLVTLSAVFMLVWGGFVYMTAAANTALISKAKGIIRDAIVGLLIALAAWLILYIINPNLVNLTLNGLTPVSPSTYNTGYGGRGSSGTFTAKLYSGEDLFTDAQTRSAFGSSVDVNKSDCSNAGGTNCTSLGEFPKIMAQIAIGIKNSSNCGVVVTGGTEAGHSTHGKGRAAMDMRRTSCLDAYFSRLPKIGESGGAPIYQYTRGVKIWFEDSQHYHIWEPAN